MLMGMPPAASKMPHSFSSGCCGVCGRTGKSQEAQAEWIRGSVVNLVAIPLLPYLAWAVLYYIKVHVPSWQSPSVKPEFLQPQTPNYHVQPQTLNYAGLVQRQPVLDRFCSTDAVNCSVLHAGPHNEHRQSPRATRRRSKNHLKRHNISLANGSVGHAHRN